MCERAPGHAGAGRPVSACSAFSTAVMTAPPISPAAIPLASVPASEDIYDRGLPPVTPMTSPLT